MKNDPTLIVVHVDSELFNMSTCALESPRILRVLFAIQLRFSQCLVSIKVRMMYFYVHRRTF